MERTILSEDKTNKFVFTPREVVELILTEHDSIFEKRLQAIAFLSELQWVLETGEKQSNATYYRKTKNIYSDQIRNSLSEIPKIYSRIAYDNGYRTYKMSCKKVNVNKLNSEKEKKAQDIIVSIIQDSKQMSKNELMKFCINLEYIDTVEKHSQIDIHQAVKLLE